MNSRFGALSVLALAAGIGGGIAIERFYLNSSSMMDSDSQEILYWVAPMDPNFRQDNPGKSPMGMDLIPVYDTDNMASDPSEVKLSGREINAIGVRSAIAKISDIANDIDTVGFVTYDDNTTTHVHSRVNGWIETMDVRSIGERVKKGDRLYQLFSPEFGVASYDALTIAKTGSARAVESARNKMRSHGASERQIANILSSGKSESLIDVFAPQDGIVVNLVAQEGMYLQPGNQAATITNLSTVWIIVDVFERDMGKLTQNMSAVANFEHIPGQEFRGFIDYIYPALDEKSRTLPVRLRFDNAGGLLKPNMFGTVVLSPGETREAITVPSEAVIRTGKAERVILKTGEGTFKPRLVTTGLRNSFGEGNETEIIQGLEAGEEVVASAQFLIDSESSLSAGLTRMAPTEDAAVRGVGQLINFDTSRREATIQHDAFEALDWPAMETKFPISKNVNLDKVIPGSQVGFKIVRGSDGVLFVSEIGDDDGVAATGTGMVTAVTADGKLNIQHEAIPDIGWPAMQMDMTVEGIDPASVPMNEPIEFDLEKAADGNFNVVAVRSKMASGSMDSGAMDTMDAMPAEADENTETMEPAKSDFILVDGVINSIDVEKRMANITHGPMTDIGMPGMTMDFSIDETVDLEELPSNEDSKLLFTRNPDFSMTLMGVEMEMAQ